MCEFIVFQAIFHSPQCPGLLQLPLDAEEFTAAQLLLDGALQKEGPAVAGGISIVGEQDHQQEHHVDQEILETDNRKGLQPIAGWDLVPVPVLQQINAVH